MVGGGGALSARCIASPPASMTIRSCSGALSSIRKRRAARARRSALPPIACTATSRAWRRLRLSAPTGSRRLRSDPEPHERRADLRLPHGGRSRHLRQAADRVASGRKKRKAAVDKVGPHLRAHPPLHRLSARAPRTWNGAGRRTRRNPARLGRISAGQDGGPDRDDGARQYRQARLQRRQLRD
jgi:hypothetical protein